MKEAIVSGLGSPSPLLPPEASTVWLAELPDSWQVLRQKTSLIVRSCRSLAVKQRLWERSCGGSSRNSEV